MRSMKFFLDSRVRRAHEKAGLPFEIITEAATAAREVSTAASTACPLVS